jgi:AGZA family xanthine/uracil permease-like MFS transporter
MKTSSDAPRWWVPRDWNGFFGLFTNVVLNVIVLTGLCLHVVNLPADIVYGRILPALGIALPLAICTTPISLGGSPTTRGATT